MNSLGRVALFVVAAVAAAAALVSLVRMVSANLRADSASTRLVLLESHLARMAELRARESLSGVGPRPDADLIDRITGALAQATLPPESLKSLQQQSDTAVPGGRTREQRVALTIEPITPVQLGMFLAQWRDAQPVWRIAQIDLSHAGPEDDPASTYRAQLSLRAAYIAAENGEGS